MKTPLHSPVLSGTYLVTAIFWLAAAAAKFGDHDNFTRQLASIMDSEIAADVLSFGVPALYIILSLLFIRKNLRPLALNWSIAALVIVTILFVYLDLYRPGGVCVCLALTKGVEWQGSWVITGCMLLLCLTAKFVARRSSQPRYDIQ